MKLRIRDNTVRIRLTRSEVGQLRQHHAIRQVTLFSTTQVLVNAVIPSHEPEGRLTFSGSHLSLRLPIALIECWADSSEVGIRILQPNGSEGGLQIVVEKDFACLHHESDDTPDAFPHPERCP